MQRPRFHSLQGTPKHKELPSTTAHSMVSIGIQVGRFRETAEASTCSEVPGVHFFFIFEKKIDLFSAEGSLHTITQTSVEEIIEPEPPLSAPTVPDTTLSEYDVATGNNCGGRG